MGAQTQEPPREQQRQQDEGEGQERYGSYLIGTVGLAPCAASSSNEHKAHTIKQHGREEPCSVERFRFRVCEFYLSRDITNCATTFPLLCDTATREDGTHSYAAEAAMDQLHLDSSSPDVELRLDVTAIGGLRNGTWFGLAV